MSEQDKAAYDDYLEKLREPGRRMLAEEERRKLGNGKPWVWALESMDKPGHFYCHCKTHAVTTDPKQMFVFEWKDEAARYCQNRVDLGVRIRVKKVPRPE